MRNALRDLPAWGISLVVNLTILFALSLIVAQVEHAARQLAIDSAIEEQVLEEEYVFKDTTLTDAVGSMGDTATFTPAASLATQAGKVNDVPLERRIEKTFQDLKLPEMAALEPLKSDVTSRVNVKGNETEVVAGGVEGVMDRITLELRRSLEENRTMAIWLFDASGSLKERRGAIAERFDTVYKQLAKLKATEGLYTVAATFGKSAALLTPTPVEHADLSKVVEAVKSIPNDPSGIENVFTALRLCVEKFRASNPGGGGRVNKLVFIVTDERGDDFQMLEEVINLCKQYHFRVFVVGNAAVFGQEKGFVEWKDPSDGEVFFLPVDQGPESSHAQVLQLPFLGGGLGQISAGFGPYTLSRLCAETGGRYFITEEGRGEKFDPAVMRNYTPDYRPVRVIEQEIRKNPALTALVQAASLTYDPQNTFAYPETLFRAYNDNILREELREAQKPVAEINYKLNQMFSILSAGEKGRANISDARWQASFDLAMGRLLAMRVRMEGYNRMLAAMSVSPRSFQDPQNNMWRLVPSDEVDTGPTMRKAAEQAREYLKRVIDEHPGTPWALLAEKELSQPLGWSWKEERRTVPGMEGRNLSDEERVRLLLAEDERREQERQRRRSQPRELPKL